MTKTFMVEFQPTPEWKNYAFGFEQFTYTWMAQKSNKYQLTDFLTEINEEGFFVYDKNFDDNFLLTVKDFELYWKRNKIILEMLAAYLYFQFGF